MSRVGRTIHNPRTGQRMTFLETGVESGGRLLRIDCFHPAHSLREREHLHPRQENRFEVRSGALTFCVDGQEKRIGPGQRISIPPGTPHYFWNAGGEPAHYFQEFSPALRIEALFETGFALAQNGRLGADGYPSLLQTAVMMDGFSEEFRVTQPPVAVQLVFRRVLAPLARLLGYHHCERVRGNFATREEAADECAAGNGQAVQGRHRRSSRC
jgi:mannose-6-phosphate isomerase-like protein (cupin superfamily)